MESRGLYLWSPEDSSSISVGMYVAAEFNARLSAWRGTISSSDVLVEKDGVSVGVDEDEACGT